MDTRRRTGGFIVAVAMLLGAIILGGASFSEGPVAAVYPGQPYPISAIKPARLADTRPAPLGSTVDGRYVGLGRRPAGKETVIAVAGRGGVPVGAASVAINLTSVQPDALTFLTAYPCGAPRPNASNVNSPAGIDRANGVFVKLSSTGTLCIYNDAGGDFTVDVNGWADSTGFPQAVTPARLLDTRPGLKTVDGLYSGIGRRRARSETIVQIAGRGGVPIDATAAFLNITAERPTDLNYVTAYPCGSTKPDAVSTLNLPAGDTRANNVLVQLNPLGAACFYTVAETDLIVDVNGYTPGTTVGISQNPVRIADSRVGQHTVDGKYLGFGRVDPKSETQILVFGRAGVPARPGSVYINLTAENPDAGTYLTAYPCGEPRPEPASSLNVPAHETGANQVLVKLSPVGTVCVYSVAATDIIVDLTGYVPSFEGWFFPM